MVLNPFVCSAWVNCTRAPYTMANRRSGRQFNPCKLQSNSVTVNQNQNEQRKNTHTHTHARFAKSTLARMHILWIKKIQWRWWTKLRDESPSQHDFFGVGYVSISSQFSICIESEKFFSFFLLSNILSRTVHTYENCPSTQCEHIGYGAEQKKTLPCSVGPD